MVKRIQKNLAYGLNNALQTLYPEDIFADQAPSSNDIAELGTFWVYNNQVYKLTSSGTWTQLANQSGSGTFSALTVVGTTSLTGATSINANGLGFTLAAGTGPVNIATSGNTAITIGNTTGTTAIAINSSSSGIVLNSNSTGRINIVSATATSATTTVVNNSLVGSSTITGLTTASGSTAVITLTNSLVTASNCVLVSASNLNVSTNGAAVGIQSIVQASGSLVITLKNNGGGALGTGDNVKIAHLILG